MRVDVNVDSVPSMDRIWKEIRDELGRGLLDGGLYIVGDCAERIHNGVDLYGRKQKPNSPIHRKRKQAHRHHTTPLRYDDHLIGQPRTAGYTGPDGEVDPPEPVTSASHYRINGRPLSGGAPRHGRIDKRGALLPIPRDLKVTVSPPKDRVDVITRLIDMGYRVPWGISREARKWILKRLRTAIAAAKGRIHGPRGRRGDSITERAA